MKLNNYYSAEAETGTRPAFDQGRGREGRPLERQGYWAAAEVSVSSALGP